MVEWFAVVLAGAFGGIVNCLLLAGGITLPKPFRDTRGQTIWSPGIFGNIVIGATSGFVFWGLSVREVALDALVTSWRTIAFAVLMGVGGSQLLTKYVERNLQDATLFETGDALERLGDVLEEITPDAQIASQLLAEGAEHDGAR